MLNSADMHLVSGGMQTEDGAVWSWRGAHPSVYVCESWVS